MSEEIHNLNLHAIGSIDKVALTAAADPGHRPRILLLHGSLRQRSHSRLVAEESARVLERLGAEARLFSPSCLPLSDEDNAAHPKVVELRDLANWAEGMV